MYLLKGKGDFPYLFQCLRNSPTFASFKSTENYFTACELNNGSIIVLLVTRSLKGQSCSCQFWHLVTKIHSSKTIEASPIIYRVFSRNDLIYNVAFRNSISAVLTFYLCFIIPLEIKKSREIDLGICNMFPSYCQLKFEL